MISGSVSSEQVKHYGFDLCAGHGIFRQKVADGSLTPAEMVRMAGVYPNWQRFRNCYRSGNREARLRQLCRFLTEVPWEECGVQDGLRKLRDVLDAHEVVQIDAEITKLKHQRINLEQH